MRWRNKMDGTTNERNGVIEFIQNHVVFCPKKFVVGALLAAVDVLLLWQVQASFAALVMLPSFYLIVSSVRFKKIFHGKWANIGIYFFILLVASIIVVYLSQFIVGATFLTLPVEKQAYGALVCTIVFLFLFGLTMRLRASVLSGAVLLLLLATANYYVYVFRGNELLPGDLLAFGTAMTVVGQYEFAPVRQIVYGWSGVIALSLFYYAFEEVNLPILTKKGLLNRMGVYITEVFLVCLFLLGTTNMYVPHFQNGGSWENGFLLNFALSLKSTFVEQPNGYNSSEVIWLSESYVTPSTEKPSTEYPSIIVIMNESFADFCVLEEGFCQNHEVLSFYHSLSENVIKGYALSSVYGGRTPNSEYEFLTGHSMAFLPDGSIPYQQFVKNTPYSMISTLNSLGYHCVATHPYESSGWNRPAVYQTLGFSEWSFLEDYPQGNLIRDYVSDQEMFDYIIDCYEQKESRLPLFLFGVTMQNHGSYTYSAPDFQNTVNVEGYSRSYEDVNQYLTVVNETDKALEYLLNYFSQVTEDVVIVMFGDHYPGLEDAFYRELHGKSFDTLDDQMKLYQVPFLIWTNYSMETEFVPCTSLNYLAGYVYKAAGISLPAYSQFLKDVEQEIPAMNVNGYYSKTARSFLPYNEEVQVLEDYRMLQYNAIFDHKNRSPIFFPIYTSTAETRGGLEDE